MALMSGYAALTRLTGEALALWLCDFVGRVSRRRNPTSPCIRTLFLPNPLEIYCALAPIGRINPGFYMAAKTGIRPIPCRQGQAVLDRVVMNVVNVADKIGFVTYMVLPVPLLPHGLCALAWLDGLARAVLGEPGFYQAPAGRKISIARRQRPDAMQMVGHDHHGVDVEGARLAYVAKSAAQDIYSLRTGKNRPPPVGDQGEEKTSSGGECASVVHGLWWVRDVGRVSKA